MRSLLSGHMADVGRLPASIKDSSIRAPAMQTQGIPVNARRIKKLRTGRIPIPAAAGDNARVTIGR
jgi:hypothetical protein